MKRTHSDLNKYGATIVLGFVCACTTTNDTSADSADPETGDASGNRTDDDDSEGDPLCDNHEHRPTELLTIIEELKALSGDEPDPSSKHIYAIPAHWSPFWAAPLAGYIAASDEMGFSGEFNAACDSSEGDIVCSEKQVAYFQTLTDGDASNGEADAIAVGSKSAIAMESPISAASDRIPIITFDSDVNNAVATGRETYLGAMNLPAGETAGDTMLGLVNSGTVRLIASTRSAANLVERAAGAFSSCVSETFADASEFLSSSHCADVETSNRCEADCTGGTVRMTAEFYNEQFEADADFIAANPEADSKAYLGHLLRGWISADTRPAGLISLHGTPSPVVEKAISDHGVGGQVQFVAWDFSAEVQVGIGNGTVDAAMVQNAYFYGYMSAHIAYAMAVAGADAVHEVLEKYYQGGISDNLLDTGMTVITPENQASYTEYQEVCLHLTSS